VLAVLVATSPLSGCAWLIGHAEVPQPRSPLEVASPVQTVRLGGLTLEARFAGVGDRRETARNWLGRLARVVNPYGEDTWLFEIAATNGGAEDVVLLPRDATLVQDGGEPRRARTLDDYRRRWPTWAIEGDEQAHDRHAAYGAVLDSILLERHLAPGGRAAGRLAFPGGRGAGSLTLQLPVLLGTRRETARWRWEPR
jgi:hypothetical protein